MGRILLPDPRVVAPSRRRHRWRRIRGPRYQFTTWDPGGCACCGCQPCVLPFGPLHVRIVSYSSNVLTPVTGSGEGTIAQQATPNPGFDCSWNGLPGSPLTSIATSNGASIGVTINCNRSYAGAPCTLVAADVPVAAHPDHFYYNNPGDCDVPAGYYPLVASSVSCTPLYINWTAGTGPTSINFIVTPGP